jgi:signal transduction histidine kinase
MPGAVHQIDFTLLRSDVPGEGLEALVRHLGIALGLSVDWSGRGSDGGADLTFTDVRRGFLGDESFKWLVQCKDHSQSGRSVSEADVGPILEKTLQHKANGFLLVSTTTVSTGLKKMLDALDARNGGPIRTHIWDGAELRRLLLEKATNLLEIHFRRPDSSMFSSNPGRIALFQHHVASLADSLHHYLSILELLIRSPNQEEAAAKAKDLVRDCRVQIRELVRLTFQTLDVDPLTTRGCVKLTRAFFERVLDDIRELTVANGLASLVIDLSQDATLRREPSVQISAHALELVAFELIQNAVVHSKSRASHVKLRFRDERKTVHIDIENEGLPIHSEEMGSIFQVGYRAVSAARHSSRGLGMGLFLVSVIVEQCGGNIALQQDGSKTLVTLSLPKIGMSKRRSKASLGSSGITNGERPKRVRWSG